MRTIPDDDGLNTVSALRAPAFTGIVPDWLEDASHGGSTAARDAGHDGGYFHLSPAGGEACLRSAFQLQPGAYDVLELHARLRTTDEAIAATMGFERSEAALAYEFANEDPELTNRMWARGESTNESFVARVVSPVYEHDVVLRWDTTANSVALFLDGMLAASGTVALLDPSVTYRAFWRAVGDRGELRISHAAVRYLERANSV